MHRPLQNVATTNVPYSKDNLQIIELILLYVLHTHTHTSAWFQKRWILLNISYTKLGIV